VARFSPDGKFLLVKTSLNHDNIPKAVGSSSSLRARPDVKADIRARWIDEDTGQLGLGRED
jgi:hypothetical protein